MSPKDVNAFLSSEDWECSWLLPDACSTMLIRVVLAIALAVFRVDAVYEYLGLRLNRISCDYGDDFAVCPKQLKPQSK